MHVYIKVHPNSKKEKIIQKTEHKYEIFCKEKAENNQANKAIKRILAHTLNTQEKNIRQISGRQKPQKIFWVK